MSDEPEISDEVYWACAVASWEAQGTQRLWTGIQRETYVALMLGRPDWRALVDTAYRAGYGQGRDDDEAAGLPIRKLPSSSGDQAPSHGDEINSAAVIFGHPNQVVAYRYVAPDGHVMVLDPADVTVILADEPDQPRRPGETGPGS